MREEFGSRLRRQRKKLGMTQMELADISGVSQTSIGCYERGTRFPKLETVRMIADALQVSAGQLMAAADVVEVVRCKDCVRGQYDAVYQQRWCMGKLVKEDHFCSYGERKNG